MSRVVSTLRRLYIEGESTLAWMSAIDEMVSSVGDGIPSQDETDLWAGLSHFFVCTVNGDPASIHLRNVGLLDHEKSLKQICEAHRDDAHPHPRSLKRRTSGLAQFRFIDLFAGVGGFHLALASLGGRPVFVSEWDNAARITYARNFGIIPYGDIRTFTTADDGTTRSRKSIRQMVPECDLVSAGFPCQPFSLAGVSSRNFHGLEHGLSCTTQGTLFEDVVQIAVAAQAKAVLLENVKNLASHDQGRTLPIILERLRDSGFKIFPDAPTGSRVPSGWAVQDSSIVSAQRRKRIYFAAVRADLAHRPFEFPRLKRKPRVPMTVEEVLKADHSMSESAKYRAYALSEKLWKSHRKRDAKHAARGNGFRSGLITDPKGKSPTLVARYYKDGKDCLIPHAKDKLAAKFPPRMLTPRECAVLQTFPDDFLLPEAKTPAYKQMGNSITVEVARQLAHSLIRYLYPKA